MAKPKIEQTILEIYRYRSDIVNDDAKLVAAVWLRLGWDDRASLYENLRKLPQADTITRARRKLHEQGIIVYSEPVDSKRFKKFKQLREEYGRRET